jgi:parvulin-like peptidyl-prolyl isomerase
MAAFSLSTNQVSEVVTTAVACHIIKLNEKIPARKIKLEDKVGLIRGQVYALDSLRGELPAGVRTETVSNLIQELLKVQEIQRRIPAYVENLRKDADVQILEDSLKLKDQQSPPSGGSADK